MSDYDKEGNRKIPYVENSTRGKSLIQPLKHKDDVLVQVWIDSRLLATLTNWLETSGEYPRFLSEVVRRPLEMLLDYLIQDKRVTMSEDTAVAREMLSKRFKVKLNKGDRGRKNVLHNTLLSEKSKQELDLEEVLAKYKEIENEDKD